MRCVGFVLLWGVAAVASAHNSYTSGYSGAPGMRTCASSCHGSAGGTLTVSGFPTAYQPGQTYRITIRHSGGSPIVNFNATTRVGSTSTVGGTFAAITNSALYAGGDGGVYASPHAIDSAVFQWTAPATGAGPITLYTAAFQGTTSRSSGQNSATAITSTEIVTTIKDQLLMPTEFRLCQNYPNPFNPATVLSYQLGAESDVTLRVFNTLGQEVAVLVTDREMAGFHSVRWNATNVPSGTYFFRLQAGGCIETKTMVLMK